MKKLFIFALFLNVLIACMPFSNNAVPTRTPRPTQVLPTPYPTLPIETQNEFYELLQTNGGCEFPCFLGVTPGITPISQAILFFEMYEYDRNLRFEQIEFYETQWYQGYFSIIHGSHNISFYIDLQFVGEKIIGLIVNSEPILKPDRKSDRKTEFFVRYGIIELFSRHGVPEQIYLSPTRQGQPQSYYSLEIIYFDKKIIAKYSGFAELTENNKYKLCPVIGDGNIELFDLAFADPASNEINIREFLHGSFNQNFNLETYGKGRLVELDSQGIYDLFIKQSKRCFYEDEYWLPKK
jgi:hypothetical protein